MDGFASKKAYKTYKKQKRRKSLFFISIILIASLMLAVAFDMRLSPMVRTAAVRRARSIATYVISETVCSCIEEEGVSYDDLVSLEKNNNGEIAALTTDIVRLNKLKSNIAVQIYDNLSNIDKDKISLPIGTVLDNGILAGKGPKINISIKPVGSVTTDYENVFISAGINQTNHRIMIKINVTFSVIMPFRSISETVETSVCAAETVLVGSVPDAFTNVQNYASSEGEEISDDVADFGAHNNLE